MLFIEQNMLKAVGQKQTAAKKTSHSVSQSDIQPTCRFIIFWKEKTALKDWTKRSYKQNTCTGGERESKEKLETLFQTDVLKWERVILFFRGGQKKEI